MRRLTIGVVSVLVLLGTAIAMAAPATQPGKAPKPTTATDPAGCTTADCHASVKQYTFVHGPVAKNSCDACHKLTDPATHTFKIWREKADLCTYCHEFSTGAMPVIHKPVQTGECLGCHNPHGGPAASMMREKTMAELCARCHDSQAMTRRFMHSPVKDGDCGACHQPHASKYPKLVDAAGADLCLFCHKDFKAQMAKVKFVHKAQENGCGECHDVHGSDFPKEVTKSIPDLCLGCHEKIKTESAQAMYKHPAVLGDRACLTCHTTHGGDLASLMSDTPLKICMTCHNQSIKDAKGKLIPAVSEVLDPATFKHGPIRDGQCGGCHEIHGGGSPLLLWKTNSAHFYEDFSADKYEMCFSCHDPLLASDDPAQVATQFRNGRQNLHALHVAKDDRGHNCSVCHATHASRQEQNIRQQVPFGKWQLPIVYIKTETGGSCDAGCHGVYSYDRENPVPASQPTTQPTIRPTTRPTADHEQPVLARFSTKDIAGAAIVVPDATRPTVLMFLRAEQLQSEHVRSMVAAALTDGRSAQAIVVLSGAAAKEHATELAKSAKLPWPIIADPDFAIARPLGVEVWPATMLVRTDATVLAHIGGAPLSLTVDLSAYLDFVAGKLDRAALDASLASHAVVSDGPAQKATWHLQMAQKLMAQGNAEQARAMLADGLKLQGDSIPLQIAMVNALVELKQPRQAMTIIIKLPKDALPAWQKNLLLAKVAVAQGRPDEARLLLNAALKDNADLPEAHYLLGRAYEQQSDWPNAAREYRAAQELK